jgi:transposase-like protein
LKRENRELREANEILRRASIFFAGELCATRRRCAVRRWELREVQDLLAGLSQQPGGS